MLFSTIKDTYAESDLLVIPVNIRFGFFLSSDILSVLCSLFVQYHLLTDRILRQALNNHAIIVLLCFVLTYELTTVPLMLYYYHVGDEWIISAGFSHFWTFIDYLSFTVQLTGFAWTSIERHILIFHNQWVHTKIKRFLIHYLPLLALIIYCFVYHFAFILFPSCETSIIMSPFNGVPIPCILFEPFFIKYDAILHQIIPTFVIGISTVALFLRVHHQKARFNRSIQWRKERKIIIQSLSISLLYLSFMSPRMASQCCVLLGFTTKGVMTLYFNGAFLAIYTVFLFPFVCCVWIPEIGKKMNGLFLCERKRRRVIVPALSIQFPKKQRNKL
ncbi:unnamed protein product [Adineta ricciae]|uniref:Uncharacterized protein n=1 Tax=Adineta ricciae TaxID=249248 RepID=A0A815PJQ8_ADIRI|nr:unnamed protein product [Adineta ricciae]CAF1475845.1 unnamed protein product [Adineta ricciae]